ncbi:helix-turn-helix domain-containing protein [Garciella nitratireducens]|uniref:DNA-binding transcriptional regulator, XRE-family HTH domain n=1 Tax=Garciella nitratireducens DSM 15102 TaxID=1121911 RepID=A0A1T4K7S4_9FIRM|nr:helix-turn-helix transcriptional regulator [Garciella nitratireducens]SJZ38365.1 DNA-binding transcriptional regulator, XRE-family HTH domain [Garciella nitratireducens DSM 15102]
MKASYALTKFRNNLGLTQVEMANRIGISLSFYSKLEMGERNPSFNFMTKFKKAFPLADVDIFFDNKIHLKCDKDNVG